MTKLVTIALLCLMPGVLSVRRKEIEVMEELDKLESMDEMQLGSVDEKSRDKTNAGTQHGNGKKQTDVALEIDAVEMEVNSSISDPPAAMSESGEVRFQHVPSFDYPAHPVFSFDGVTLQQEDVVAPDGTFGRQLGKQLVMRQYRGQHNGSTYTGDREYMLLPLQHQLLQDLGYSHLQFTGKAKRSRGAKVFNATKLKFPTPDIIQERGYVGIPLNKVATCCRPTTSWVPEMQSGFFSTLVFFPESESIPLPEPESINEFYWYSAGCNCGRKAACGCVKMGRFPVDVEVYQVNKFQRRR